MTEINERLIVRAREFVGHKETGLNDSPLIRPWLLRVGAKPRSFWCAAFAWCMLDDVCSAMRIINLVKPTASSHRLLTRAREQGLWLPRPLPGTICGIDHGKGTGHIVIVVGVDGDLVTTIEGNSNLAGSRNADSVVFKEGAHRRRVSDLTLGCLDPARMYPR